jgi:hypothetical protein
MQGDRGLKHLSERCTIFLGDESLRCLRDLLQIDEMAVRFLALHTESLCVIRVVPD